LYEGKEIHYRNALKIA